MTKDKWIRTARRAGAALFSIAAVAALASCGTPGPKKTDMSNTTVVTVSQEERIRKRIIQRILELDDSKDTEALKQFASGPELTVRTSQLAVAKATDSIDQTADIPDGVQQIMIPTEANWPRSIFSITTTTENQQSGRLLVFSQDSARQNYKLWGLVRLFSGVQLPTFRQQTPATKSSAEINDPNHTGTVDQGGLVMTPADAVRQYADILQNGSSSKYAKSFENDSLRTELAKLTATIDDGVKRNGGTQQQTFTYKDGAIRVLMTAQASRLKGAKLGALVIAQIDSSWTRTAGEDRTSLPISDAEKALFGDQEGKQTIVANYTNVVALYVPYADSGSNAKVECVGAERVPVSVEAR